MNKLKLVVLAALIIGAAYVGLNFAAKKMIISELDKLSKKTEFAGELKYDSVCTNLLTAKFSANNVSFISTQQPVEAVVETVALDNIYSALISKNFTSGLSFENVKLTEKTKNKEININLISFDKFTEGSEKFPKELGMTVKGLHLTKELLGKEHEQLSTLGYESVLANLSIDYSIDEDNKVLSLNTLSYGAEELGEIVIKLKLGAVDLTNFNPIMFMFSYPKIELVSASCSYTDDSFFNRYIEMMSKKTGQSKEDIIKKMDREINAVIAQFQDPAVQDILLKLKDFLHNPKHITLSANPETPITLGEIQNATDPVMAVKLMNAKATL